MKEGIVDVFEQWFTSKMEGIHTILPGRIDSYKGHSSRLATVIPSTKLRLNTGESLEIPPIQNVPVMFPGSGQFQMLFPLKKGDGVLLLFSESGLGNFLNGKNVVSPEDATRFSLTDCIAIPGLWSKPEVPSPNKAILEFRDGALHFSGDLVFDGNLDVKGEVTAKSATAPVGLSTHLHPTPVGPTSPPTPGT